MLLICAIYYRGHTYTSPVFYTNKDSRSGAGMKHGESRDFSGGPGCALRAALVEKSSNDEMKRVGGSVASAVVMMIL